MRRVMCILNGQLRRSRVRDRPIASEVSTTERADKANPEHAPRSGTVTRVANPPGVAGPGDLLVVGEWGPTQVDPSNP